MLNTISKQFLRQRNVKMNYINKPIPFSFEKPPDCKECKYCILYASTNVELTICTLFNSKVTSQTLDVNLLVNTDICRNSNYLCGPQGHYFKEK